MPRPGQGPQLVGAGDPVVDGLAAPPLVPSYRKIGDGPNDAAPGNRAYPRSGTGVVDFGATPGTNTASVAITGQTAITATSNVRVWLQGNQSTGTHNAYEHRFLAAYTSLTISAITPGVGFTVEVMAPELRLDGTIKFCWTWE